ncbi:MAG: neutral/alkaline non-lysosomal ceramidase N-terminal domain-containing protein [Limisphaerales bacterium]
MKRRLFLLLAGLAILGAAGVSARAAAAPDRMFRAGAATSVITPWLGVSISGGFQDMKARHVHDELHARCLVLDDGQTRLAFVMVDVALLGQGLIDEAKALIREHTGIPPTHVLIAATHTHSAPTTIPLAQCEPDPAYQQFLVQRVADGVRRAANQLAPARIGWGSVDVPQHVFNRRWKVKPGTVPANPFGGTNDLVRTNPGVNNPDLVEPAGPTDPQVWFISVQSTNGRPVALLADYSLHYVGGVNSGDLSADYYGVFAERMTELLQAERSNPPFVAMLANGTSGNINNVNFRGGQPRQPAYGQMRLVANDVAAAVHGALGKVTHRDWVPLAAAHSELKLAVRRPAVEELPRARELVSRAPSFPRMATLPEVYARESIIMADWPAQVNVPLQAFHVGELRIGSIPGEPFAEVGLELKRRSPNTFVISLANGYYGYIPTPEQHRLGGYETWRCRWSFLETDASVRIVDALLGLLGK